MGKGRIYFNLHNFNIICMKLEGNKDNIFTLLHNGNKWKISLKWKIFYWKTISRQKHNGLRNETIWKPNFSHIKSLTICFLKFRFDFMFFYWIYLLKLNYNHFLRFYVKKYLFWKIFIFSPFCWASALVQFTAKWQKSWPALSFENQILKKTATIRGLIFVSLDLR